MKPTDFRSRLALRIGLAGALLLSTALPASAARPTTLPDVTFTGPGRSAAADAAERFAKAGVPTDPADLRVYELGPDDYLVGPANTVLSIERDRKGAITAINTAEPVTSDASQLEASDFAVAAAAYWQLVGSTCWARTTKTGGWMDTCYHKHKLMSDGNGSYDWFELHMFGTAASTYPYRLFDAYVHASPAGGATQTWHDWSPRSDLSVNCSTITIGVVAQMVGIAYNHNACETWDITKYAAAGTFRTTWRTGIAPPLASEREAAFVIASRVANGGTASWQFSWNFTPRCC